MLLYNSVYLSAPDGKNAAGFTRNSNEGMPRNGNTMRMYVPNPWKTGSVTSFLFLSTEPIS